MFYNSSFVIHSFFFIILAWSHKYCSIISVPCHSFHILCFFLIYPLTGLPFLSTSLFKKYHSITAVFSVFVHVHLSLLLYFILISSSFDNLHENPYIKLAIPILFPNKSSHSSSPKTIMSSLSTFKGVLFIVAWLRPPGTYGCIPKVLGRRTSHELPASFTPLLGIFLLGNITLICEIMNFRLYYHQYFHWDIISGWLSTKARESPAPNFTLKFFSLRKVVSQV